MISHGQAVMLVMVTTRILREVEREIPEMGGGRVAVSFLFLSTKMTSTVLLRYLLSMIQCAPFRLIVYGN